MTPTPDLRRKDAILRAAIDHFGRFGFRGASLRDIAGDAGVSLTLLNHHFGSKSALLAAALGAHRQTLRQRVDALGRLAGAGAVATPRGLVGAWIGVAFDTAAQPDGASLLRLLARLDDDPVAGGAEVIRDSLDEAAGFFIDALQRIFPDASRGAAASAWLCVNASLLKMLAGGVSTAGRPGVVPALPMSQTWLERFMVAGIEATLGTPEPEPDAERTPTPSRGEATRSVASTDS